MNQTESFLIDHNTLKPGLYAVPPHFKFLNTYDLRFYSPNSGTYLTTAVAHSCEHIFAWYFKNISKFKDEFVSINFGACMTMAYLEVVRDHICDVPEEIIKAIDFAQTLNHVPGATPRECGNYRSHNLKGAKKVFLEYKELLMNLTMEDKFRLEVKAKGLPQ